MENEFRQNGVAGEVVTEATVSDKSKVATALLCFFLGTLGIHRFYVGKAGTGFLMLALTVIGYFTAVFLVGLLLIAIVGIWDFVDFICILIGSFKDSQGRKLK